MFSPTKACILPRRLYWLCNTWVIQPVNCGGIKGWYAFYSVCMAIMERSLFFLTIIGVFFFALLTFSPPGFGVKSVQDPRAVLASEARSFSPWFILNPNIGDDINVHYVTFERGINVPRRNCYPCFVYVSRKQTLRLISLSWGGYGRRKPPAGPIGFTFREGDAGIYVHTS